MGGRGESKDVIGKNMCRQEDKRSRERKKGRRKQSVFVTKLPPKLPE